jgi:nitrite reductase/ring-hydroxylating ferredoxin subunit
VSWLTDRLSKLMLERNEPVEALARQLGIERSRLSRILEGAAFPNDNLLKRLARHFGEEPEAWLSHARRSDDAGTPAVALPSDFTTVATVAEIPAGAMRIVCNGLAVVANVQGRFHAFGNICPHAGGPIGEGFLEGVIVECPWHAGQWDITTGQALTPLATADIPVFEVRITGETIEIRLAAAVPNRDVRGQA